MINQFAVTGLRLVRTFHKAAAGGADAVRACVIEILLLMIESCASTFSRGFLLSAGIVRYSMSTRYVYVRLLYCVLTLNQ